MKIKINGNEQTINQASLTIAQVLVIVKVDQPEMVTVQLNGEFVRREDFDQKALQENDEVDFLYLMAGGIG